MSNEIKDIPAEELKRINDDAIAYSENEFDEGLYRDTAYIAHKSGAEAEYLHHVSPSSKPEIGLPWGKANNMPAKFQNVIAWTNKGHFFKTCVDASVNWDTYELEAYEGEFITHYLILTGPFESTPSSEPAKESQSDVKKIAIEFLDAVTEPGCTNYEREGGMWYEDDDEDREEPITSERLFDEFYAHFYPDGKAPQPEPSEEKPIFPLDIPDEVFKEASTSAYLSPEVVYDAGTSSAYIQGFCVAHARFSPPSPPSVKPEREERHGEFKSWVSEWGELLYKSGAGRNIREEFESACNWLKDFIEEHAHEEALRSTPPPAVQQEDGEVPEEMIGKMWEKDNSTYGGQGINPVAYRIGAVAMYHKMQEDTSAALTIWKEWAEKGPEQIKSLQSQLSEYIEWHRVAVARGKNAEEREEASRQEKEDYRSVLERIASNWSEGPRYEAISVLDKYTHKTHLKNE